MNLTGRRLCNRKKKGEPIRSPLGLVQLAYLLVLSPVSAVAASSPMASAYFFPEKRISDSDLLPSAFFLMTVATEEADWFMSTNRAGTVATTLLPFKMLSSTFEPLPSHFN